MIREVHYIVPASTVSSHMPQKVVPKEEAGIAKTVVFPWLLAHAAEHKTPQSLVEAAVAADACIAMPAWLASEKHWIWPLARKAKRAGKPKPSMAWIVGGNATYGQPRMMLDAKKRAQRNMTFDQLTRAFGPGPLPLGGPRLKVTITRWSVGQLDNETEGLRSAWKAVLDAIAFWAQHGMAATGRPGWQKLLGHGDERITWLYEQGTAPMGVNAISIRIDDGLPGEDIIVGAPPRRLSPQEKGAAAQAQALLPEAAAPAAPVVLPVIVALPWEQDADDPTSIDWHDAEDVVGRRLLRSIEHRGYPMHFDVKHPKTGRAHKLLRSEVEHPASTARVWLYEAGKTIPETPSVIRRRDRKNARRA